MEYEVLVTLRVQSTFSVECVGTSCELSGIMACVGAFLEVKVQHSSPALVDEVIQTSKRDVQSGMLICQLPNTSNSFVYFRSSESNWFQFKMLRYFHLHLLTWKQRELSGFLRKRKTENSVTCLLINGCGTICNHRSFYFCHASRELLKIHPDVSLHALHEESITSREEINENARQLEAKASPRKDFAVARFVRVFVFVHSHEHQRTLMNEMISYFCKKRKRGAEPFLILMFSSRNVRNEGPTEYSTLLPF